MGPEYSGLLSHCYLAPSSFLHHPGQRFCAFIDQFGLTMIRQKVAVAVNLYHFMVSLEGDLEVF